MVNCAGGLLLVVLGEGLFVSVDVLRGVELFCSGSAVGVFDAEVGGTFALSEVLVDDALDIVVVSVARRLATDCTALAAAADEDCAMQDVCGHPE